ncbi:MAG TPA: protein kinase, partial [Wenzhouxiangellaceae bacterium]|nr:protein kinase [Wenzhouxiangellaceae bacterium]
MTGGDWKRLEALFYGALEQPESKRDAWLASECDDAELLRQLQAMLAADAEAGDPAEAVVSATLHDLASGPQGAAGKSLGPWRILETLGSGGMGSVFLAERADDEYRRRVALKLIRGFPDPASLERLRTERQILADLNHPNIAAMIDGGTTDDGQPYLVMEYVEGVPVDQ